jgi:ribosomal protein L11 methyltransferase
MGASQVTGLDIDPQALIATTHNASLNQLPIQTLLAEDTPSQTFDVVVANILANPLIELSATLTDLTQSGGHIVMAGLLDEQADQVKAAYPSILFDQDVSKDGWTRLSGRRPE